MGHWGADPVLLVAAARLHGVGGGRGVRRWLATAGARRIAPFFGEGYGLESAPQRVGAEGVADGGSDGARGANPYLWLNPPPPPWVPQPERRRGTPDGCEAKAHDGGDGAVGRVQDRHVAHRTDGRVVRVGAVPHVGVVPLRGAVGWAEGHGGARDAGGEAAPADGTRATSARGGEGRDLEDGVDAIQLTDCMVGDTNRTEFENPTAPRPHPPKGSQG